MTGPCVGVLFKCYACTSQIHPVIVCGFIVMDFTRQPGLHLWGQGS